MAKRKSTGSEARVRLSSGTEVPLDGDLVFLIDQLYRDFARQHGFAPGYADVQRELEVVLEQMDDATAHEYFRQSLFLNYVTYENEMAARLAEQLTSKRKPRKVAR